MALPTLGVKRRRGTRSPEPAAVPEPGPWSLAAIAWVLSALGRPPVCADQVRDKAVGLGLFRLPAPGEVALLTAMAVSRLFLAGYGLPAAAERGTLPVMLQHHRSGRRVFVAMPERDGEAVREVQGFLSGPDEEVTLADDTGAEQMPRSAFTVSWAAAGCRLIVAAPRWEDLPADGSEFFGGFRNRDGSYHWTTAECDTDRQGRIVRY
jgi:hypothetical protein